MTKALTTREWVKILNDDWDNVVHGAVEGFIKLGRDLTAAKEDIKRRKGHGAWMEAVTKLKFRHGMANVFMRIVWWLDQNVVIDHNLPKLLPPDYNTILKITRLETPTLQRLIENGTISPNLQRNEISKILRLEKVTADETRIMSLRPKPGKYRTIVVDPAWEYDWLSLAGRAKPGYAMQNLAELHEINLRQWADKDCELYCWTTNNFMYEACKLVDAWGFQHRTLLTWIKPPPFGLGSYFRNSTEHVLYATLGKATTRPPAASISTHFDASRGDHSEKPEAFYDLVRLASYPPYGEGNQRKARSDFTSLFETVALKVPITEAAE